MNTVHRVLPILIFLFGALAIWGRINREIVRQVRGEELCVDQSIKELRELVREPAAGYPRPLSCGRDLINRTDEIKLEAERQKRAPEICAATARVR